MSERLQEITLTVNATTGGAGTSSGSAVSPVFVNGCEVYRVWWNFDAATPATADVALYETALGATLGAIDAVANSATDVIHYPRIAQFTDLAGAALAFATSYEVTERYMVPAGGTITATIAQGDVLAAAVVVKVLVRRW